jgi:hypothetical protein
MRALAILAVVLSPLVASAEQRTLLRSGWTLQSSAHLTAKGDTLSTAGFDASGWHKITVPNTWNVARTRVEVRTR